ncbi:MAG TPA: hypothetical protein VGF81_05975, partial [Solirubrobacteraceae bacterium]
DRGRGEDRPDGVRDAHASARANWLPAPTDGFHLILRLYQAQPSVFDGSWKIRPLIADGEIAVPVLSKLLGGRWLRPALGIGGCGRTDRAIALVSFEGFGVLRGPGDALDELGGVVAALEVLGHKALAQHGERGLVAWSVCADDDLRHLDSISGDRAVVR